MSTHKTPKAKEAVMVDYELGQRVKIFGAPDIEAVVTAYMVRQEGQVQYELTWVHSGDVKTSWLTTDLIETKAEGKIGFIRKINNAP